jgi:CubicO group peptidase (beta-lactamase class C family)
VAGWADIEEKRPVTPETVFAWASVSKTITAVTAMTLLDEGKLALDDDVNRFLPFHVAVPSCPSRPITIRQLLTHTSGISEQEDGGGVYLGSYVQGDSPIPLGAFLASYLVPGGTRYDPKVNFVDGCPGTQSRYSNVGAALLAFVAERISATSFDELAARRVFEPLGMRDTSFRLAALDRTHLAMPYEKAGAGFAPLGHVGYPTYPDGLVRSSVPDMARFLRMFIDFGAADGVRILTRSTALEMRRPAIPELDEGQALIWHWETVGDRRVLGHNGRDPGVHSRMYFDPADGTGVLVVANGNWSLPAAKTLLAELFERSSAP